MYATGYDMTEAAKALEAGGFTPLQARTLLDLQAGAWQAGEIATKTDLARIELAITEMQKEIVVTRREVVDSRKDLELKVEAVKKETLEARKDLELKIEQTKNDLVLKVEEIKKETLEARKDLELKIEQTKNEIIETRHEFALQIEDVKREILENQNAHDLKLEEEKRVFEQKLGEIARDIVGIRKDLELGLAEKRSEIAASQHALERAIDANKAELNAMLLSAQRHTANMILGLGAVFVTAMGVCVAFLQWAA